MSNITTSDAIHVRNATVDETTAAQTLTAQTATVTGATTISGTLTASAALVAQLVAGGKTVQTIATSPANTINVNGRFAYVTGAGIATCVLATGTIDGQDLTILNIGAASTIVSGSGVAAASTLASLGCHSYIYDLTTTLWYQRT